MSDDLMNSDYGAQSVDQSGPYDMVNYEKIMPGAVASIANLNDRLKKVENG